MARKIRQQAFAEFSDADDDGRRYVGVAIGRQDDGSVIVGNPFLDCEWAVPLDCLEVVDEPLTGELVEVGGEGGVA